ncbi:sporulation protein kinase pit1-like [Camellia sinensis]|uniref:sporulation protein kinase pit1-like n=1 Tax=Camellia sinensis TaxID=4442 RepID=UPI001035DE94|nr:sporulation protein kinase pit1-like [Camellia sinensis]
MVLIKRKHEELEIKKSVYGDGKLWFRGPIIGKSSSRPVYLATLKKPTWRLTHLPILMVMKSAEVSDFAMLQREAMVLNNFHACPYIHRCFGEEIMTGYCNCIIYNILLKYGSGGTVADLIKKSGGRALLESDVRCYTRHIIEGLDCVHSFGYVDRALKPENIIVVSISTSVGIEYVANAGDFGLAKTEKQMRKMMTMSKSYKLRGYFRFLSP